jgi:hypothetical protein
MKCENLTFDDRVDWQVRNYNNTAGYLTGYECAVCKNRGDTAYNADGYLKIKNCECRAFRIFQENAKESGLQEIIKLYSSEKYVDENDWQKNVKYKALKYVNDFERLDGAFKWFCIFGASGSQGTYLCFEVGMPSRVIAAGRERVDLLTYNTVGEWRFYELKISKSDFHSKNANTFLGHYNYYVMPLELYEQVKNEIPDGIGCYVAEEKENLARCIKKPKRQELKVPEDALMFSFMQALSRQHESFMTSKSSFEYKKNYCEALERTIKEHEAFDACLICKHSYSDADEGCLYSKYCGKNVDYWQFDYEQFAEGGEQSE